MATGIPGARRGWRGVRAENHRPLTALPRLNPSDFYYSFSHLSGNILSTMNSSLVHGAHHDAFAASSAAVLDQSFLPDSLVSHCYPGTK